ncbi:hypothetical protein [Nannocystis radixulma]|uniref:Uncharacterized protein n=1 Tax=Nannocystis radixulma TaxID=2995305 RepID=A0ABT5B097_9BACT|nr:hypothetical protein [Nannocystis radixulma]MDC0667158.1 hypothetical protein [Nannocystis radixulma]
MTRLHRRLLACVAGVTASLLVAFAVVLAANPGCACEPRWLVAAHEAQDEVFAVEQFKILHDRCPRSAEELRKAGITARVRTDPWGRPYVHLCGEDWAVVCSLGEDGVDPTDDICSPGLG